MRGLMSLALVVAALATVVPPAAAHNSEQAARLRGKSVVGSRGDSDGRGRAEIKSSAEIDTLCYKLWFSNVDPVVSAHIHQAVAGQNGEVAHTLFEGKRYRRKAEGCDMSVDASLLESMQASPQGYYLDLHTRKRPNGALRGQLVNLNDSDYFQTCDPYKPEDDQARKAGTLIVSSGATESEPTSVKVNAPAGTPDSPTEVLLNLQLTTEGQPADLFVRYEFAPGEDYGLVVENAKGEEKARADGVNPAAIGPLSEPNDTGGHSEQGAEQIDGLPSEHCGGYTLRLMTNSGMGGRLTLKVWTTDKA